MLLRVGVMLVDDSFAALDLQTLEHCLLCTIKRSKAKLAIALS